jgi:hypothetical protein
MIKPILFSATLAAATTAFVLVGCGGSSSSNNNGNNGSDSGSTSTNPGGGDGGGTTMTGDNDAGGGKKGSDDGGGSAANPPLPDGSILPHGNQLATGQYITINGVTSDDYVVYTDTNGNVSALSLASGSKAISLGTVDPNANVRVMGKTVFIPTTVSQSTGAASISVWTSKATAASPLTTSGLTDTYAASSDGSFVAFFENLDATGSTATMSVAAGDGSNKTQLVPGVDLADDICFPFVSFGGSTLVATYCEVGDAGGVDAGEADGGTNVNVGVVTSFSGASWTPVNLASNSQTVFSLNSAGTQVVVITAAGSALVPIGGGTAVPIDPNAEIGAITLNPGIQTNDGTGVIYTTTANALERATTTAPVTMTQLGAPQKFNDVFGLSSDQKWLIGTSGQDANSGAADLYLASATAAGASVTLSSTQTAGAGNGSDLFTTDSTAALFFTSFSFQGGGGTGTLTAQKVSGGAPTVLGQNSIFALGTSAAKVVFNENFNQQTFGADLYGVDTSAATPAPTLLVTQADPSFYLNAEKTTIIYTWSYDTSASAGLWTLAAP